MTALQFAGLETPQDPAQTTAGSKGTLPPELHVALARLNAELNHVHRSIRSLMQAEGIDADHLAAAAQYQVLEAVIHSSDKASGDARGQDGSPAAAESTPPPAAAAELPLGGGCWRLRENGWLLAVPGCGVTLALKSDERSILLRLARSPEHRIGGDELRRLVDTSPTLGMLLEDGTAALSHVVRRLRRRVRNLGLTLPLRASRDGGYQFIGDAVPQRRGTPLHVVTPKGHRLSQPVQPIQPMATQAKAARA